MFGVSSFVLAVKVSQYKGFFKRWLLFASLFYAILFKERTRTLYQYPGSLVVLKAGLEPARPLDKRF